MKVFFLFAPNPATACRVLSPEDLGIFPTATRKVNYFILLSLISPFSANTFRLDPHPF